MDCATLPPPTFSYCLAHPLRPLQSHSLPVHQGGLVDLLAPPYVKANDIASRTYTNPVSTSAQHMVHAHGDTAAKPALDQRLRVCLRSAHSYDALSLWVPIPPLLLLRIRWGFLSRVRSPPSPGFRDLAITLTEDIVKMAARY